MAPEKDHLATSGPAPESAPGPLPIGSGPDIEASLPAASADHLHHHHRSNAGDDDALAMVGAHPQPYSPATAARAVRKIDWFLIPAMIFGCSSPFPTPVLHSLNHPPNSFALRSPDPLTPPPPPPL